MKEKYVKIISGIFTTLAFAFICMWLWNSVIPDISPFKKMNYWQSLGMMIMVRLMK